MYPTVSVGKPVREREYLQSEVDDYLVYLDGRLHFTKAVIDFINNRHSQGLKILGVQFDG